MDKNQDAPAYRAQELGIHVWNASTGEDIAHIRLPVGFKVVRVETEQGLDPSQIRIFVHEKEEPDAR